MFLSFWDEYNDFFIILIGIVIGMVLAYLIFFKPNKPRNKKNEKIEENENLDSSIETQEIEDEPIEQKPLEIDPLEQESNEEEYVLGEYSNIFDSIKDEEENEEEETFLQDDVLEEETDEETEEEVSDDSAEVEEIKNDFEAIDDLIEKQEDISVEPDFVEEEVEVYKDPEEEINKIVNQIIQKEDIIPDANIGKYHVLFRKDDKKWYVKKEGKEEIEKFLVTQKEAIAYATIQALIYDTTIVVHDEDGKIGKYEF